MMETDPLSFVVTKEACAASKEKQLGAMRYKSKAPTLSAGVFFVKENP